MPFGPSPAQSAGVPSPAPQKQPRDHFAEYVNRNAYIPMWLHPDLAAGVLQHFGRDGSALVHPHPGSVGFPDGQPQGMQAGGAVAPQVGVGRRGDVSPQPLTGPASIAAAATAAAPLAGMPVRPVLSAQGAAGRSIFGGGPIGTGGPAQQQPAFVQSGAVMDGRGGAGRVPGQPVPASQKEGHDTVHAMLDPGELVANQKQLRGIQVRPGKGHLLRSDQKKAIKNASRK